MDQVTQQNAALVEEAAAAAHSMQDQAAASGFIAYGAWSFKTLHEVKVNGPIYERIVQSKDLIADILPPPEYIIESYLVCMQIQDAPDAGGAQATGGAPGRP
jgi:radical SAM superfamily enzyme